MARVPNPYASPLTPIGNSIAQLGSAFFAGPSPIEQERLAGDAAYKQALTDKALFDVEQSRRQAAARDELAGSFGGQVDPTALSGPAVRAGYKPSELADLVMFHLANAGAGDEALVRARTGAGGVMKPDDALTLGRQNVIRGENFGQERTLEGMQQAGALERVNAQQAGALQRQLAQPVTVGAGGTAFLPPQHPLAGQGPLLGAPTMATTRGDLLGENFEGLEELDQYQRKALGAEPSGMTVYGPDGQPIVQLGSNLTTGTRTALQGQQVAIGEFQDILSELRSVAASDPTLFGTAGNVRRGAQALGQQAQNVGQLMGWDVDAELNDAAAAMAGTAVDPQAFDPNLTDIEKLATLAAYKAAAALAAQEGRSISDKDFTQFRQVVGDPTAWTASQPAFMAGLNRLESLVGRMAQRNQAMQGGQPLASPAPASPPMAAPPGLPPGQPGTAIEDAEAILQRYGL